MSKEFKSFFKIVGGNEGTLCRYNTRLDVYGCGCSHDCSYCYAKSLLEFRNLWNPKNPSVADIKKIESKLKKIPSGSVLRLGGMTDCFQAEESRSNVTYETIKLLNKFGIHYLIVTKSHLVSTQKYLSVMDKKLAHIQISITNTNDKQALEYENASLTSKRLESLKILQDNGFDVSLRISPFIESFINFDDIKRIVSPKKILVEFLRVNHWIEKWFGNYIKSFDEYKIKSHCYKHLDFETKKKSLERLKESFPTSEVSVCEDYVEHYEFWKHNFNPNPDDCCNLSL